MNRSATWIACLGFLTIGYGLQLFSPLRTNTDATCFLQMGASASDGLGFVCCKGAEHFPIGYPALISALDRAGFACSATFIGVNLLAILSGLFASIKILEVSFGWTRQAALFAGVATLLNWVMIKHVTLPLTDIPYFGLSLMCLLVLTTASWKEYPRKIPFLCLGLGLLIVCLSVRTIGIALIPAFAYAAISGSLLTRSIEVIRSHRPLALGATVFLSIVALLAFLIVSRTNYFRELLETWSGLNTLVRMRLEDWGELVINTSMAKVPAWMQGFQILSGVVLTLLIMKGLATRRKIEVVDIYMAGYLAILFVWPYRDARFWIPVLPLLLGYAGVALRPYPNMPRLRWAPPLYLAVYTMMGLVALGYSTWLSFSGEKFGDRFAGGVYRDSYRMALHLITNPNSPELHIDPQIVRLVERYKLQDSPASTRPATLAEAR